MKKCFRIFIVLVCSALFSLYDPPFPLTASEILQQLHYNNYEINQKLLNRSPDYFWNNKKFKSKGSAGVIPYCLFNGKLYLLVARESRGKYKNKYCDLGGAVEVTSATDSPIYVDTFLHTALKEAEEESGGLYNFKALEFLEKSYTLSYLTENKSLYHGFESTLSFFRVNIIYMNDDFILSSQRVAKQKELLGLSPAAYQEKDDYQWIEMRPFAEFLETPQKDEGYFKNILDQTVKITFRGHFLKTLRSECSKELLKHLLNSILTD